MAESSKEIIFIVGATGTGKSDLAVDAASIMGAEIINADSVQMFQRVNIGAAKPTAAMRARVPHHLFDFVEPGGNVTAGEFRRRALPLIESLITSKNVLIVGGSGFYIQALEVGMYEVPPVPPEISAAVEEKWQTRGNAGLWEELNALDPETAAQIHVNDTYRLKRSVSLIRAQGKPLSQTRAEFAAKASRLSDRYPVRKVGLQLPRERLRDRIVQRTRKMLEAGLVEEVRALVAAGLRDWWPMKSVGYAEVVRYLDGELSEKDLPAEIAKSTMALAKRQVTWFKRDREIRWFNAETELTDAREYLLMRRKCEA